MGRHPGSAGARHLGGRFDGRRRRRDDGYIDEHDDPESGDRASNDERRSDEAQSDEPFDGAGEVFDPDEDADGPFGEPVYLSVRPVLRLDDGTFFLNLPPEFRDLLRKVIEDLRERIAVTDPSVHRLFPTAYPDNPDLDAEYQRLMRDELVMARFAVLDMVFDSLDEETLDEAQVLAWMQAMNVLRLSLGTELGVDHDEWALPDDDPRVGIFELYSYLGILVGSIIEALGSPT